MLDNSEKILADAIEAHEQENFVKATQLYLELLRENPTNPDANHNIGILTVQTGNTESALLFLETAVETNPNVCQYWISLIDALIKLGRFADADRILKQAIKLGHQNDTFAKMREYINSFDLDSSDIVTGSELKKKQEA